MTIRQLLPGQDDAIYLKALQEYLDTTDHEKTGYTTLSRMGFVNNHSFLFDEKHMTDYRVIGDVVDNEVVGLAIGYKNDIIIDRLNKNIVPGWHLAFTWKRAKDWKAPQGDLLGLTHPICLWMESQHIFTFTKIMRYSEKIVGRVGVARYIEEVHLKNVPDKRYNCHVEKLIRTAEDVAGLPVVWRRMMPEHIIAPLLLVSHQLKNELRAHYL
jgi:hypothetical protein